MGEKLKLPPLIEAACEFRFAPAGSWDWTLPGRLYERIKDEFPERAELGGIAVQITDGKTGIAQAPDRIQMKRQDGSALVQVGPYMLAVNHLLVYPGWEAFRDLALDIYSKYMAICGDAVIERVGLRYINQIGLPEKECDLADFTSLDPPLGGTLKRPLAAFYQRYELQHDTPRGLLIHQTGIRMVGNERFLMVDIDFGSVGLSGLYDSDKTRQWLNVAHERVLESFIDSLNRNLYERLRRGEQ